MIFSRLLTVAARKGTLRKKRQSRAQPRQFVDDKPANRVAQFTGPFDVPTVHRHRLQNAKLDISFAAEDPRIPRQCRSGTFYNNGQNPDALADSQVERPFVEWQHLAIGGTGSFGKE